MTGGSLSIEQRQRYAEDGYCCPLRVLDEREASELRARFDAYWASNRERLQGLLPRQRHVVFGQTHAAFHWVYRIVSHPKVLDAVESILGPNLLVWESAWFIKFPHDKAFISWHQDANYWGLQPPNVMTAWVALSDSTPKNGCMRVIPGSHKMPALPQKDTYAADNALSRGQEIAVSVDESQAVDFVLQPGEMSIHHAALIHGSRANDSDRPRIGLAIRYITPDVVREGTVERQLAMVVRGRDDYHHFELFDPPREGADRPEIQAEVLRRIMLNASSAVAPAGTNAFDR
jgi:non-heme Fe2+,alpha-ketoglutarate-dependent halogenase